MATEVLPVIQEILSLLQESQGVGEGMHGIKSELPGLIHWAEDLRDIMAGAGGNISPKVIGEIQIARDRLRPLLGAQPAPRARFGKVPVLGRMMSRSAKRKQAVDRKVQLRRIEQILEINHGRVLISSSAGADDNGDGDGGAEQGKEDVQSTTESEADHMGECKGSDRWHVDFTSVPTMTEHVDKYAVPAVRELITAVEQYLPTSTEATCAFPTHSAPAICAYGTASGVGKTLATVLCAREEAVQKSYRHGVHWIKMGETICIESFMARVLSRFIENTGATKLAKKLTHIMESDGIDGVVRLTREWCKDRCFMLVLDDVYPSPDAPFGDWIRLLQQIIPATSCILFSTRFGVLAAKSTEYVTFSTVYAMGEHAKRIMRAHMKAAVSSCPVDLYSSEARQILEMCDGLPIALGVAGCLLRKADFDLRAVWDCIRAAREAVFKTPGDAFHTYHPGLAVCMRAALQFLDKSWNESCGRREDDGKQVKRRPCTWKKMYDALIMAPEGDRRIPVEIVSLYWSVGMEDALHVAEIFADFGLLRVVKKKNLEHIIELHDMHYEVVSRALVNDGVFTSTEVHDALLSGHRKDWSTRLVRNLGAANGERGFDLRRMCERFCGQGIKKHAFSYLVKYGIGHVLETKNGFNTAVSLLCDHRLIRRASEHYSMRRFVYFVGKTVHLVRKEGRKECSSRKSKTERMAVVMNLRKVEEEVQSTDYEAKKGGLPKVRKSFDSLKARRRPPVDFDGALSPNQLD